MFWLVTLVSLGMYAAAFHVVGLLIRRYLRLRLRRPRFGTPPDHWHGIVDRHVPLTRRLSPGQRDALLSQVQDLVQTRAWHGCGGLVLTEEMQVVIAAQACLLTLERQKEPFARVNEILVYPHTFVPRDGLWSFRSAPKDHGPTLGEAWTHGVVILSWNSVTFGATNPFDGRNVTLHEFAHQLDAEDGTFDGVPLLAGKSALQAWVRMLDDEHPALEHAVERGKRTVLAPYGATNRAEFFAVATEAFFEKPAQLRRKQPQVYEALRTFYQQDPAASQAQEPAGSA